MRNTHPKATKKPITQRNYTPKVEITKAKRYDVPPTYRRNRKHDVLRAALVIASVFAFLYCIVFFTTVI